MIYHELYYLLNQIRKLNLRFSRTLQTWIVDPAATISQTINCLLKQPENLLLHSNLQHSKTKSSRDSVDLAYFTFRLSSYSTSHDHVWSISLLIYTLSYLLYQAQLNSYAKSHWGFWIFLLFITTCDETTWKKSLGPCRNTKSRAQQICIHKQISWRFAWCMRKPWPWLLKCKRNGGNLMNHSTLAKL